MTTSEWHKRMEDAKEAMVYLNYCVKEGVLEQEDIEDLSVDGMIELADKLDSQAIARYDSEREQDGE